MPTVRILVADDHDLLRRGLHAVLESNPEWTVVAEAANGREAIEKALEFKPDVAILDFSMPELNGLEATRQILKNLPLTKILVLTVHDSDTIIQEMRQAGIRGYLLKAQADTDLVAAMKAILRNETFFPSRFTPVTHRQFKSRRRKPGSQLTPRQQEILKGLARGDRTDDVAVKLGISKKTVETHRQNILFRTNCHSTAELVRYAIRNGLIEP